jgi:hypothetical protein
MSRGFMPKPGVIREPSDGCRIALFALLTIADMVGVMTAAVAPVAPVQVFLTDEGHLVWQGREGRITVALTAPQLILLSADARRVATAMCDARSLLGRAPGKRKPGAL